MQGQNAVNFARRELARTEELLALQLATGSQVDMARRALQDALAALEAQRLLGGDVTAATVTAPFDGVVVALPVAQGDRVQPGATILQLGHVVASVWPATIRTRVPAGKPIVQASGVRNRQRTPDVIDRAARPDACRAEAHLDGVRDRPGGRGADDLETAAAGAP